MGSPFCVRCHVRRIVLHCHRYFQEFCRHVTLETSRALDHISHLAWNMRGRLHCIAIDLVIRTLDDRWPIGDILFGTAFYAIGQVILFAFSNLICDAVKHYIDGLFLFQLCILLSVMMVYKYWDSITKEDLEFSVGSKVAVWEVKDPLLAGYGNSGGGGQSGYSRGGYGGGGYDYEDVHGPTGSIVGGTSGAQMYAGGSSGKHGYPPQGYY